jgi:hypothetical protein
MNSNRRRVITANRSRGAVLVEFALTIPILFLVVFATVDVCNRIYLRQAIKIMAYEGARVSTIPGATEADVIQQIEGMAADRSVRNLQIDVSPSGFENASFGTFISVEVRADTTQGLTSIFLTNQCVATVSMMKESE